MKLKSIPSLDEGPDFKILHLSPSYGYGGRPHSENQRVIPQRLCKQNREPHICICLWTKVDQPLSIYLSYQLGASIGRTNRV